MRKGFTPVILIAILALVIAVGGVGIGLAWRTEYLDRWLPPSIKEMFGRGEKPDPFQQILSENCRELRADESASEYFSYGIDLNDLPILIDSAVIKIEPEYQGTFECEVEVLGNETGYVCTVIRLLDGWIYNLNIYDKYSIEELGSGGPPRLGSYGIVIEEIGDVKLTAYLEGPGPILVEVRGEKRLRLSSGEIIFVNVSDEAMSGDDPRLVDLLRSFEPEYNWDQYYWPVTYEGTEEEEKMVERFFGDMAALESPEKENINEIKRILDAITPK